MRHFFSGYIHEKIKGDGELILLTYIIADNTEEWERIYYQIKELKHGNGCLPDVDIKTLSKDYKKRFEE